MPLSLPPGDARIGRSVHSGIVVGWLSDVYEDDVCYNVEGVDV